MQIHTEIENDTHCIPGCKLQTPSPPQILLVIPKILPLTIRAVRSFQLGLALLRPPASHFPACRGLTPDFSVSKQLPSLSCFA
jgi:hypothetical protein